MGQRQDHGSDPCPVAASLWCSQCCCYGHLPSACDEVTHVTRPRTLEDIIRQLGGEEILERWGIKTSTPIIYETPTLEVKEREIADINTVEVRYREGQRDRKIREVMRSYKISTVHKMEDNLLLLRNCLVDHHGKKLRLVQEDK